MNVNIETNPGRGVRPVTPARVRAKEWAEAYSGLPEGSTKFDLIRALKEIPREVLGLGREPRRLLIELLDLQDARQFRTRKEIEAMSARLPGGQDRYGLVCVASNQYLASRFDVTERSITRHLATLAEREWIAFIDGATRKRARKTMKTDQGEVVVEAYGIDLRPVASRFSELLQLAASAVRNREQARRYARDLSAGLNRLNALAENLVLRHRTLEIVEMRRQALNARKRRNLDAMLDALNALEALNIELEIELVTTISEGSVPDIMSGGPDETVYLRTVSPESINSEELDSAWRGSGVERAGAGPAADGSEPSYLDEEPEPEPEVAEHIVVPTVAQVIYTLPGLMERHGKTFTQAGALGNRLQHVIAYAQAAEFPMRLSREQREKLKAQLGPLPYAICCLLAAYDDRVRDPIAWLTAMGQKAEVLAQDRTRGGMRLDLRKSWYGVVRRASNTTEH